MLDDEFRRCETLCTKSLYLGLIGIKNIDLPHKLSRNTKIHRCKQSKRILGHSIEECPSEAEAREEFGHWETDIVIGQMSDQDNGLLTLLERETRQLSIIGLPDKSAGAVMDAFARMKAELGASYSKVFRTITTDNGSEFSRLWSWKMVRRPKCTLRTLIHPVRRAPSKATMV